MGAADPDTVAVMGRTVVGLPVEESMAGIYQEAAINIIEEGNSNASCFVVGMVPLGVCVLVRGKWGNCQASDIAV